LDAGGLPGWQLPTADDVAAAAVAEDSMPADYPDPAWQTLGGVNSSVPKLARRALSATCQSANETMIKKVA
jgi:hypothetical protein